MFLFFFDDECVCVAVRHVGSVLLNAVAVDLEAVRPAGARASSGSEPNWTQQAGVGSDS